jgi:hypothetical protein
MSKDNQASLSFVYKRWNTIHTKLFTIAEPLNCFAHEIKEFITGGDSDLKLWHDQIN